MKKTVLFAVVIIVACLVVFPSCDNGSGGGSLTTADLEGIWVATGEEGETAKAMLFEFSGNNFTRIAYTELTDADPDGPDMIQDEGSKGTFSVSDDTLTATVTHGWEDAEWAPYSDSRSTEIDLQGDTLMMAIDGPVYFEKKSFSLPSALVDTWYDLPDENNELDFNADDGTYSYSDPDNTYTGTWTASLDLLRIITTDDTDSESSYYIENLYEYEISEADISMDLYLSLSWDDSQPFSEYTNNDNYQAIE